MNFIERFINFFLPIRDNEINQLALWKHPHRYAFRSGVLVALFSYLHVYVLTGFISSVAFALAVLFEPPFMAGVFAILGNLARVTPYR